MFPSRSVSSNCTKWAPSTSQINMAPAGAGGGGGRWGIGAHFPLLVVAAGLQAEAWGCHQQHGQEASLGQSLLVTWPVAADPTLEELRMHLRGEGWPAKEPVFSALRTQLQRVWSGRITAVAGSELGTGPLFSKTQKKRTIDGDRKGRCATGLLFCAGGNRKPLKTHWQNYCDKCLLVTPDEGICFQKSKTSSVFYWGSVKGHSKETAKLTD